MTHKRGHSALGDEPEERLGALGGVDPEVLGSVREAVLEEVEAARAGQTTPAEMLEGVRSRTKVLWVPYPGMQERALAAAEFEVLMGGAKGPGKSDLIIAGATRQVDKPLYKALITRETGPQMQELKDRTHRLFPRMAKPPHWVGEGHGRWTFPSGAKIDFMPIGTQLDVERIHGMEYAYVGQDEVGNIPDERVVDLVQAEIRCPDPSVIRFWRGSANPGKPGHAWCKRRFIKPCGIDGKRILVRRVHMPNGITAELTRRYIPGTVLDNPIYANDPLYMAQLFTLPEVLRKQLLYGDWEAGVGQALGELDEGVHLVRAFEPPEHWVRIAAFDWGFAHNWVFLWAAVDEDGDVWVIDAVWGRRHRPDEIAGRILSKVDLGHPSFNGVVPADSASFQSHKGRGGSATADVRTIAEEMMDFGIILGHAVTDRKAGLNNARHYLAWRGINGGQDGEPAVRLMDTPGNRRLFEQLESMVTDERDMEDVLKVDCDPETGIGGDDGYDCFRYLLAQRPPRAIGTFFTGQARAFSPETLAFMKEQLYRDIPESSSRNLYPVP